MDNKKCNYQGTRICTQNQIKLQLHGTIRIIFETKSTKISNIWKQELFFRIFFETKAKKSLARMLIR